jgi:hypothetical protein
MQCNLVQMPRLTAHTAAAAVADAPTTPVLIASALVASCKPLLLHTQRRHMLHC